MGAESKYRTHFKTILSLISPILEKDVINRNFHDKLYYLSIFKKKMKSQCNISGLEKKRQSIYDLLHAEANSKFLCKPYAKLKKLQKKLSQKRRSGRMNKKRKGFLTAFATAIKKDPRSSIVKHANELKVPEKTVRTRNKHDLSPDLNPLGYTI